MKKIILYLGAGLLLCSFVLPVYGGNPIHNDKSIYSRKIIVYKNWFKQQKKQDSLLILSGAIKIKHLKLTNSTTAYVTPLTEKILKGRKEILRMDQDIEIRVHAKEINKKPLPNETLSWGIARIFADLAWSTTRGRGIKLAVLDTGIDLDHPDLKNNIKGDINFIRPKKSGDDDNGHGTHVAGIAAAVDNEIGVIGTGPEISLFAVKVLDKKGSGWLSDLIEALNWCVENKIQVINMSFGSTTDNQSFHDAINRVYAVGIIMVASAGNNGASGGTVEYPAKYSEVISVSAVDQFNHFATFSSFGPEIELIAPGVNILSTYNKGSIAFMEGTSMSAPFVTGTVALLLTTNPNAYDLDHDNFWDPDEIRSKLRDTAENLGLPAS
ncbi:MAG: S8 family peptidase, partial [Candidatus Aminicenantes bacterium]|nr:S8 family peptidase [Candidatus Aminicenantes bacterium]